MIDPPAQADSLKRERNDDRHSTDSKRPRPDTILHLFTLFRDEIDTHNDRRERLIKISRDATSLSKKVIFHLHRYQLNGSNHTLLNQAEGKIDDIVRLLCDACEKEGFTDDERATKRYERNVGGGLEEFIEALSFFHFLRHGTLISSKQTQAYFVKNGKALLPITPSRYLLGLSDLTGELMRFATNAVGQGDVGPTVRSVLALLRQIRDQLDPFIPLIRDMKKKQQVTNQSVRKIEDLRKSEFRDPEALQEMIRRTLAAPPQTQETE